MWYKLQRLISVSFLNEFQGKIYLFLEAVSQLYRSFATIQPWLFYLLESYQGPEKIVGVFLSAFYMVSKGADLMSRLKLLRVATLKLLQNMVSTSCLIFSFHISVCVFLCRLLALLQPKNKFRLLVNIVPFVMMSTTHRFCCNAGIYFVKVA